MDWLILHCERCGHDWHPKKPGKPRSCAKCTARYWDRPARIPARRGEPGPIGRPALYPALQSLAVGAVIVLPWRSLPNGQPDNANAKYNLAVNAHAKRHGWQVLTQATSAGLMVRRLA